MENFRTHVLSRNSLLCTSCLIKPWHNKCQEKAGKERGDQVVATWSKRRSEVKSTRRGPSPQKLSKYQNDQTIKKEVKGNAKHAVPQVRHVRSNARSLPFRGGVVKPAGGVRGECPKFGRIGDGTGVNDGLPDSASERRNSTQRREND